MDWDFAGFWVAYFDAAGRLGAGVVLAQAGRVYGGDSSYSYWGTYSQARDEVAVKIYIRQHSQASQNVFGIGGNFGLDFVATMTGPNQALGSVTTSSRGPLSMDLRLDRVTALDPKLGY